MSDENDKHGFTLTMGIGEPSFQDSLVSAHSRFMNAIKILKTINELLPQSIDKFTASNRDIIHEKIQNLDEEGKRQYNLISEVLKLPPGSSVKITHEKTAEIASSLFDTFMYSGRIPMFIREMSLVYLISEFESFLEDILTGIFSNRPETLMSSQKIITYGELAECKKIEEAKDRIIEKEIDSIIRQDIQDVISKGLIDRFKLDLVTADWEQLKEFFYRRHIVIHNNCCPDSRYRAKTGYKGTEVRLSIGKDYLEQSFAVFQRCSELVRDSVHNKFLRN